MKKLTQEEKHKQYEMFSTVMNDLYVAGCFEMYDGQEVEGIDNQKIYEYFCTRKRWSLSDCLVTEDQPCY